MIKYIQKNIKLNKNLKKYILNNKIKFSILIRKIRMYQHCTKFYQII